MNSSGRESVNDNNAEIIRLKYKYRKLIIQGKIRINRNEAVKLIGPDSAYHLYFTVNSKNSEKKSSQS